MSIEALTSRKNQYILRLRRLAGEAAFRREEGEYVCDGMKLLGEALEKAPRYARCCGRSGPRGLRG